VNGFGAELLTLFGIGLLGSGHCLAMCGGIASALSLRAGAAGGGTLRAASLVPLYSVGRIGSYALLGAAGGALGAAATDLVPQGLMVLRTVAGVLLVLMGVYLAGLWNGLRALERVGGRLFRAVRPLQGQVQGPAEPLVLGMIWGLLPCGLVYSALAYALTAADPLRAAALMAAFGAGTLPAVVGGGLAALPLGRALADRRVRAVAGALVAAFGLWTLVQAAGHGGGGHHGGHGAGAAPMTSAAPPQASVLEAPGLSGPYDCRSGTASRTALID
jgi:sulfite exporter TauE/SafE